MSDDGRATTKRKAPWPDYAGNPIYDGDTIVHPCGMRGVVVFLPDLKMRRDLYGVPLANENWRVRYADDAPDAAPVSLLVMQINDRGQAVVVQKTRCALTPTDDGLDLDDVCAGHATATKELAALRGELAAIKARSCAGCAFFRAHTAKSFTGRCRREHNPVDYCDQYFFCNKWEPKT